jgi:hypothetical protein
MPAPVLSTPLRHAGSGVVVGPMVEVGVIGVGVTVDVGETVAVGPLTTIV